MNENNKTRRQTEECDFQYIRPKAMPKQTRFSCLFNILFFLLFHHYVHSPTEELFVHCFITNWK